MPAGTRRAAGLPPACRLLAADGPLTYTEPVPLI